MIYKDKDSYEYDAYGNCNILEPNFAPKASQLPIYNNPYLFTGRTWDFLDSGSLKIQYNRNRYYDYYTSRWTTQDPLGITPNAQQPNVFNIISQYKDSLSLYEYVRSNPITGLDSYGLWGSDIHKHATSLWMMGLGYTEVSSESVGSADEKVDSIWGGLSWSPLGGQQGYHFNRSLSGGTDSRLEAYSHHFKEAENLCTKKNKKPIEAAKQLGTALHPLQDWVAHGDYFATTSGPIVEVHNEYSPQKEFGTPSSYPDNPFLDATGSSDGRPTVLLITYTYSSCSYTTSFSIPHEYAIYERGGKRLGLTYNKTRESLSEFKNFLISGKGSCECRRYFLGVIN